MVVLTERQKKIIYILASSFTKEPITMKQIAKILNLSTRTVIRDFKQIEDWFLENDFEFSIKPGIGLILNEDKNTKLYIIDLLEVNINNNYSELERRVLIFTNLLVTNTPIKSSYFTKIFNITETAFNNDFNNLSKYLDNFNIQIVKKQGIGCYLIGDEKNLRTCYINLIYEYYKEQDFIDILKDEILNSNNVENNVIKIILKFVDKEILTKIINIIDKNINFFNLSLSDESYIELILLIVISTKRIMQNQNVIYKGDLKNNSINLEQFKVIEKICLDLEETFNINVYLDEIIFITDYFKALKQIQSFNNVDNVRLLEVTKNLIASIQKELNTNLMNDTTFLNDLVNHLSTSIHRIKMGMKIRNPFLDDIKNEYSDIYKIVYNNINYIKTAFDMDFIPETEIAYITMHFIVAYERVLYKNIKINAVLSCPTGVGTSKILSENILQKFQNVNILEIIPTMKINDFTLKSKNVDLIISTVNINTELKFIKLNPVFDYDSEKALKRVIFDISKEKLNNNSILNTEKINTYLNDDIYKTLKLSDNILSILENFKFINNITILSFENLLRFITTLFLDNDKEQKILYSELKERLDLSLPYFDEIDLLLLHCSSKTNVNINMGMINLKNVINFENKNIKHILIMILPENSYDIQRELLSEISFSLINNQAFLQTIKFSDKETILNYLKNIMINFFTEKINKLRKELK